MNAREASEYIKQMSRYGSVPGIESIRELCRRIGDPQKRLRIVHIAGTNGKGSTAAYLSNIFRKAGYRTGRYTSPAVEEYRERFWVDGKMIAKTVFARLLGPIAEAADAMEEEGLAHPTAFEIETALAFCFFAEKQCDVAVVEAGMGGALDATNLIGEPLVSVISSISMDHMQFLGKTLAQIAAQKAGIIKRGCPVVSICQKPEAAAVIERAAAERQASLSIADVRRASGIRYGLERQSFCYGGYRNLKISLGGVWQIENAVLAVETIRVLNERGFLVTERALREGLSEAVWNGRLTVLAKKPCFLMDGAHNADAAEKLAASLSLYCADRHKVFIMGVLRDKEYGEIAGCMAPLADQIIAVTPPDNPRALPAYELAQTIRQANGQVTAADSLEEAVEIAYLLTPPDGVIVAFGSLSYLGRLEEIVRGKSRRKEQGKRNQTKSGCGRKRQDGQK